MISVIIATRNAELLNQLTANIEKSIGVEHEIIAINGNNQGKGICQMYNEGAAQAKYPFLCFMHEDLLFHTDNWGHNLIRHLQKKEIALVGIFGSLIKTKTPSGVYIPIKDLNRINQLQGTQNGPTTHFYENPLNEPYSEVAILDGMFLATTINNHNKYPFDEHLLKNFHGYDIDYSLGQSRLGKIVVIYDILIQHFSHGEYTTVWVNEQLKVTNKWRHYLPKSFSTTGEEVLTATIRNIELFLNVLFSNNYKKSTQLKYLSQLIKLRPGSSANLYFIRRFLIYGETERRLKNLLNKSKSF
jgi:hypothetical protein